MTDGIQTATDAMTDPSETAQFSSPEGRAYIKLLFGQYSTDDLRDLRDIFNEMLDSRVKATDCEQKPTSLKAAVDCN